MPYFSGKTGSVRVTPESTSVQVAFAMTGWTVDVKTALLDVSNTQSGGWVERIAGMFDAEITFEGPYDGETGFLQGETVELELNVDEDGGATSFVGNAIIESFRLRDDVKDYAKVVYSAKSTGPWSIP